MKRAFASLTPQEALRIAIYIERRNAGIYQHLADMFGEFGDPESLEISAAFSEMVAEERSHDAMLQDRYAQVYGESPCDMTEEDLLEFIEVPDTNVSDLFPATPLPPGEARTRALQIALDAELAAQHYYQRLAANTAPGLLQLLYAELAKMEDGHVERIRQKLSPQVPAGRNIQ